ncbi:hypothetical protein AYO47_03470 [Planctomyces sp. SCGC AG-212-M04]|nr:hypothetical protein AYO47_03470 [Planctomyces sp. SCGC AG-212-M04]
MDTTQTKPVKKRRRWLIVAFVVALVSTVSWWYWPRGDARLVGKWEAILTTKSGHYLSWSEAIVVLRRNGTGVIDYVEKGNPEGRPKPFSWIVKGERYREGFPTANESTNALLERLRPWLPKKVQWRTSDISSERQVRSVTEQTIEMSSKVGDDVTHVTMTRIPE